MVSASHLGSTAQLVLVVGVRMSCVRTGELVPTDIGEIWVPYLSPAAALKRVGAKPQLGSIVELVLVVGEGKQTPRA
jgi:hypothetical protein